MVNSWVFLISMWPLFLTLGEFGVVHRATIRNFNTEMAVKTLQGLLYCCFLPTAYSYPYLHHSLSPTQLNYFLSPSHPDHSPSPSLLAWVPCLPHLFSLHLPHVFISLFLYYLISSGDFDQEEVETFLKESVKMSRFKHAHVMGLIGVCLDDSSPYIIMPYMANGSLLKYLKRKRDTLIFVDETNEKEVTNGVL